MLAFCPVDLFKTVRTKKVAKPLKHVRRAARLAHDVLACKCCGKRRPGLFATNHIQSAGTFSLLKY